MIWTKGQKQYNKIRPTLTYALRRNKWLNFLKEIKRCKHWTNKIINTSINIKISCFVAHTIWFFYWFNDALNSAIFFCLFQTKSWISNVTWRTRSFLVYRERMRGDCSFCWYWWNFNNLCLSFRVSELLLVKIYLTYTVLFFVQWLRAEEPTDMCSIMAYHRHLTPNQYFFNLFKCFLLIVVSIWFG